MRKHRAINTNNTSADCQISTQCNLNNSTSGSNVSKICSERTILAIPPLVYLVLFFLLPTALMVFIAFRQPGDYGGVAPLIAHDVNTGIYRADNHSFSYLVRHINLTFDSFRLVFSSSFIWQLCLRSLTYSLITTFFCLILGYPLAMLVAKSAKKYRDKMLLLVIIPFWSCFLIRVYAWMILLGPQSFIAKFVAYGYSLFHLPAPNMLYSPFAVIVCLVYVNLPFMVLPLYANLSKHDPLLIEASRDLGASRLQSFWRITVVLSIPGILAGSALVFIPSIGMFVVPELVGNNCSLMIGNLIKQQFLQTMNWPLGSVTAIIMTVLVLMSASVVGIMINKLGKGLKNAG